MDRFFLYMEVKNICLEKYAYMCGKGLYVLYAGCVCILQLQFS